MDLARVAAEQSLEQVGLVDDSRDVGGALRSGSCNPDLRASVVRADVARRVGASRRSPMAPQMSEACSCLSIIADSAWRKNPLRLSNSAMAFSVVFDRSGWLPRSASCHLAVDPPLPGGGWRPAGCTWGSCSHRRRARARAPGRARSQRRGLRRPPGRDDRTAAGRTSSTVGPASVAWE